MEMLGRYELLEKIGAGGFATVYRANDTLLEREVALKLLFAHLAENTSLRDRFLREARALSSLKHPNIVAFYDVGEVDGAVFIAMELVNGPTLTRLLGPGRGLPLERALEVMRGLCSAVDYLHGEGLVHRDIKASNV